MKQKTSKILKWLPSLIAAIIILLSASMKLAAVPELVEAYSRTGILEYMKLFAIAEILFVSMFIMNTTMRIGFFLLTAYYGGAMAVELSHGHMFVFPAGILIIIWVGAFLRDKSLFKSFQEQKQVLAVRA